MESLRSRRLDTPIGGLTLFSTDEGLVHIAFEGDQGAEHSRLREAAVEDPASSPEAARQLSEFFAGARTRFDLPLAVTGETFTRRAQRALGEIPFGTTVTYVELAEMAGNSLAVRAAGSACARNPLPIVWACHRVIRTDGTWGNYRGGERAKAWLLNFEAGNFDEPAEV
ncbi:methylated-DNA--[protein]-cysteine S-methyltransferase [Corynebacterium guangdongense]|uniref:Methylated-DNA-[protein]-cysteine S-methyltransferase n=1 Tax=Corynebacterium guangdongense TaxID=1783348 RepID=A0ABU1ZV98_9CORY|nr:methylated-DNA--[protein]-cysteine S-methyltransferase [Corynebacterium guangdongense]MDR7328847.1 methylated-DNA-[protein]-cysteine S-methyltransferase [Corynebacterium guangdongense]WJZ17422.1 Methylated-DNA--protein-cysteine methyltransferase, constitutive [Corynebacterium guangdongense]